MFKDATLTIGDRIGKNDSIEKYVGTICAILLSIGILIWLIPKIDITPATFDDFSPLNEIIVSIPENHNLIFNQDGVMTVSGDTITYTVSNEQCEMTGTYNKNFELIEKTQKDKASSLGKLIVLSALILVFFSFALFYIIMFVIYFVWFWVLVFMECINRMKRKKRAVSERLSEDEFEDMED